MKQYCRYCIYLCVNNFPYCTAREEARSKSSCTHPNNCKDFEFANVEPEYQDAFGETNGYKPREGTRKKCKGIEGQLELKF